MRKQNSPTGPGASGPSRDDVPFVERDDRDRAARQARVTDGPRPDIDSPPAAPKAPPAAHGLPHQQHDEAEPYGTTVHAVPNKDRDAPPPPPSTPPRPTRDVGGRSPASADTPTKVSPRHNGDADGAPDAEAHMFDRAAAEDLNHRFREALAGFVDSPSDAVADADEIAAQVTKLVTDSIRTRRNELEQVKSTAGGDTEQLRLALHKYRTFLQSMLKL
ncbi:hypothetical protein [Streptomyces sp. SID3343]|uniref:hypothetical protein n=1 Tax=Streptomyces sp. SID3343 TaxID=2690260 RepID=UPI00136808ED|nr:hypothetical protein [Streptomyces sp. SID3343]MYW06520.1 hypothetical protein [Streptomyces sp. SID3343]